MAASVCEALNNGAKPVCGSTALTKSIIPSNTLGGNAVRYPASPSMDFSISALQGQTETQWPQETQLDSPMGLPPSHSTRGNSSSQRMDRVSLTSRFWQASTQRPQSTHWSGSY